MRDEKTAMLLSPSELVDRLRGAVDEAADDACSLFPTDPLLCYQEAWQGLLVRLGHLVHDVADRESGSTSESAQQASKQIQERVTLAHDPATNLGRD